MNNSYDYLDNVLTDGQSNSVNFENYLDKLMYVTAPFVFNDNFSPLVSQYRLICSLMTQ